LTPVYTDIGLVLTISELKRGGNLWHSENIIKKSRGEAGEEKARKAATAIRDPKKKSEETSCALLLHLADQKLKGSWVEKN